MVGEFGDGGATLQRRSAAIISSFDLDEERADGSTENRNPDAVKQLLRELIDRVGIALTATPTPTSGCLRAVRPEQ